MDDSKPLRLTFPPFELDEGDARLSSGGRPVPLTPKALAVLCTLARRPGQLVTKGDLLDAAWGHRHVSESVLKTIVSEIRAALGDDARQPRFIETASRRGYRLIAALGSQAAAAGPASLEAPPAADSGGAASPVPSALLIGRQTELARAAAAWNAVVAGRRRVVWIAGEAGIGKTTLIDRLVARLAPMRLGRGQCVEQFGSAEPYLPVLEALGGLCRADAALPPLLRAVAPTWLVQMPWLCTQAERTSLQRELTGSHPNRMLRELSELLDRYTQAQPLLLVTEDLHWSDHATIRLIDHFARSRGTARVMWVSSFRPADAIAAEHPLTGIRHELRVQGLCDEVALDPFSEQEVADYIAGRFRAAKVGEPFVRSLHANTEGLPLFVVNVVDDLVSQGIIQDNGAGGFPQTVSHVPESVAGVIERRAARLPPDVQGLLEAASVCGVEFRCATVAEAIGCEPVQVVECCESLVRHQDWLRQVDTVRLADGSLDARYRFRHALYRHVLYERIGAHAKASLHRRAARSLERGRAAGNPVPAAEIAVHFDLGRDPLPALRHYAGGIKGALERFASVEAVQLTDRAMALLPECPQSDERLGLELVLATQRSLTGSMLLGFGSAPVQAALERARTLCEVLPQTPERALVMNALGWAFLARGNFATSRALAERTWAIGSTHDDPAVLASACDLAGYALAHQGNLAEARRVLEQGLSACDAVQGRFPDTYLRIIDPDMSIHSMVAGVSVRLGLVDQARRYLEKALAKAETSGQPRAQMYAYWCMASFEQQMDCPDRVRRWADALARLVREHDLIAAQGPGFWFDGWAQARAGDPEAGYALIVKGYTSHERLGRLVSLTLPIAFAAQAAALSGNWAQAQEHVDHGLRLAERLGERIHLPELLIQQARIARGTGRIEPARDTVAEAVRVARAQQALWLELTALTASCEIDPGSPDHLLALQAAYGRLREGHATARAAKARRLLARGLEADA